MRYLIPVGVHRVETVARRSRFITTLAPASDEKEARRAVDAARAEFPDATHHCWAWVGGAPGSTAHVGMSDDGEPHGTAGRPMLNVLLHGSVGDVVAVVTRYYGGVKLGRGGLGRAYAAGVQSALDSMPTELRIERVPARIRIDYRALDAVRRLVEEFEGRILDERFGEGVELDIEIPDRAVSLLTGAVADVTAGEGVVLAFLPEDDGSDRSA